MLREVVVERVDRVVAARKKPKQQHCFEPEDPDLPRLLPKTVSKIEEGTRTIDMT